MKLSTIILVSTFMITGFLNAASTDWKLIYNKNDISVYTRLFEGSSIKEFKGVVVMNAAMGTLLAVLKDVDAQSKWMERCKKSVLVEKINEFERIVYNITDVPWPFSDRDAVVKQNTVVDDDGRLIIRFFSTTSPKVPVYKNRVRMNGLKGKYVFEILDESHTRVTYVIKANPGGQLPGFMANYASSQIPYKTLAGMRKMAEKDTYIEAAKLLRSNHNGIADKIIRYRINYLLKGMIKDKGLLSLLQNDEPFIKQLFNSNNHKKLFVMNYIRKHYTDESGKWVYMETN